MREVSPLSIQLKKEPPGLPGLFTCTLVPLSTKPLAISDTVKRTLISLRFTVGWMLVLELTDRRNVRDSTLGAIGASPHRSGALMGRAVPGQRQVVLVVEDESLVRMNAIAIVE